MAKSCWDAVVAAAAMSLIVIALCLLDHFTTPPPRRNSITVGGEKLSDVTVSVGRTPSTATGLLAEALAELAKNGFVPLLATLMPPLARTVPRPLAALSEPPLIGKVNVLPLAVAGASGMVLVSEPAVPLALPLSRDHAELVNASVIEPRLIISECVRAACAVGAATLTAAMIESPTVQLTSLTASDMARSAPAAMPVCARRDMGPGRVAMPL
jgi:hypothetical protein